MPIFKIEKTKLKPISEKKIDLEKNIQKITEESIETIFGLKFVSSEFSLHSFRIDTLAFDEAAVDLWRDYLREWEPWLRKHED